MKIGDQDPHIYFEFRLLMLWVPHVSPNPVIWAVSPLHAVKFTFRQMLSFVWPKL